MQTQQVDVADQIQEIERAKLSIQQGDFRGAADLLEKYLENRPDDVDALTNAAIALWQLGKFTDSISRLSHAYEIAPENENIRLTLRTALLSQYKQALQEKDDATGLSAIRRLISIDPEGVPVLINLENALLSTGAHAVLSDYAPNMNPSRLGRTVLVACMPKSGSSWLLEALLGTTGFQKESFVNAYVENEQELYLPAILQAAQQDKVVQQHCRASAPNLHYIQAFGFRTVVLVRNLFDTLVSLRDFWDLGAVRTSYFHGSWHDFDDKTKLETMAAHVAPWYVQFYASWKIAEQNGEVQPHWVTYEDMIPNKIETLNGVLDFAGLTATPGSLQIMIDRLEAQRAETRFNKGVSGRGDTAFSDDQKDRIRKLTDAFPKIDFSPIGL